MNFADTLEIDMEAQIVRRGEEEIKLTPREYAVLAYFMRHTGRLISDNDLLDNVWGSDAILGDAAVRTVISRLRRKLGDDARQPRYIFTVWGRGYRFNP